MNAKQIMRTIVYIGYIIIYNLIFFMKGGMDSSAAGWIAYGFVWLAILVSYIAPLYCKNTGKSDNKLYIFLDLFRNSHFI